MPTYEYSCAATGEVYEVRHSIHEKLTSWGELCSLTQRDPGIIPGDTPVTRLVSGGNVVRAGALRNPEAPPCQDGKSCCAGRCMQG